MQGRLGGKNEWLVLCDKLRLIDSKAIANEADSIECLISNWYKDSNEFDKLRYFG